MTPKFKAITTSGKWVEGFYYYSSRYVTHCIKISIENNDGSFIEEDVEVIPETVCVEVKCGNETYFVGDTYKLWCDSHGKLGHAKKDFNVVVIYDEQDAQFKFQDIEKKHWKWTINDTDFNGVRFQRELTGNIHDHLVKPYLLKKVSNDQ